VLLGLGSNTDADAAAFAFAEAERREARLRVLHAWSHRHRVPELPALVPSGQVENDARRQAWTEQAVPRFAVAAGPRQQYHRFGKTRTIHTGLAHALLESTRGAAVVVVSAHCCPQRCGRRLGPVASVLLHHSHCPVVVVPAGTA
jgi:nucleotide-binding universal stress UspA family protein